jgi:two-component system, LytTR family, response regulator
MTAVIVDDEEHCREVLEHLLHKYCSNITLLASCEGAADTLPLLQKQQPDILFLDIEMPDMNGFQLLEKIPSPSFSIIFTTAYNEYALKAIKQSALDYLLKPVDKQELMDAVKKAEENLLKKKEINVHELLHLLHHKTESKRFAVPTMEGLIMVNADEVLYCESDNSYCKIFFAAGGKPLVISKTLKDVEEMLHSADFFRIHNSYFINMKYFQKYIRGEGGEVVMNNGAHLPVSRTRKHEFINVLTKMQ